MKKWSLLISFIVLFSSSLFSQLSPPKVENVYGGRINGITGYSKTSDSTRIFISTESANSIFYSDIYTPPLGTAVFNEFRKMEGADADNNLGGGIKSLAPHSTSGYLFFGGNDGLYQVIPGSSTSTRLINCPMPEVFIYNSILVAYSQARLYWGTIDAAGNFTQNASSPLVLSSVPLSFVSFYFNPVNLHLYLLATGSSPQLFKSTDPITSVSSATTFTSLSLSALTAGVNWTGFGVAPSGRIFIGGTNGPGKVIAYSDDELAYTNVFSGIGGASSTQFAFGGDSSSYYVYFASIYSSNKGVSGSWLGFGNPGGMETSPNDGAVFSDPNNFNIVYLTTDQGIGASVDRGATIFEIDEGVEAVQVDDFDMTPDKQTAWLASKSGIRMVTNYLSTPTWTNAIFPNGDGSPYYSAEMVPGSPNTVYAGNVRIYRSLNAGANWHQLFTAENPPYNFHNTQSQVQAIEVCDFDSSIILAGYFIHESMKGGLFCSFDNGTTWSQILLHSSTVGADVDVFDIVFNLEGTDTVAYVGVDYDLSSPTGRSVYKLTKSGMSWIVSQDMSSSTTSTGSAIVATIRDLHVSVTGDTIFACGTDAGINHPIAYYKPLSTTGKWTPFTTSGFPFIAGKQAYAITQGVDTIYVAVDNEIYFYPLTSASWSLGSVYPVGMKINILYFDDLLVGTTTGLYSQFGVTPAAITNNESLPASFNLSQNFPNPFNPSTKIKFQLNQAGIVDLSVYDILGSKISTLAGGYFNPGEYTIIFNAGKLASGTYFCVLDRNGVTLAKKMILIK